MIRSPCLAIVSAQSIETKCYVKNEDVVGALPTGDAPTWFEWSTILLPTKVWLILEIWQLTLCSSPSCELYHIFCEYSEEVCEWLSLTVFLVHQDPYHLCDHDLYIGIVIQP